MGAFEATSRIFQWLAGASILTLTWLICSATYNLFFSPLSRFPGPKWWAISNIPSQISLVRGVIHLDVLKLHQKYGPVVRIKPNELVFSTPRAFRDIYGSRDRSDSEKCFPKDPAQYMAPANGVQSFAGAVDDHSHARQRKLLAAAFSDRALREQEGLIRSYVDTLIRKLRSKINNNKGDKPDDHRNAEAEVDVKTWMNCATFDITSHLMFGESFNCLEDGRLHPWIEAVFKSIKAFAYVFVIYELPLIPSLLKVLVPGSVKEKMHNHFNYTAGRSDRRLAKGITGSDFMSAILQNGISEVPGPYRGNERIMSRDEIHSNASIIILAGSETTATLLSGCVFYLCRNPETMQKLIDEVDSSFAQESDITFQNTARLPYLNAVIEECLRNYPPVATSNTRLVPKGGAVIDGFFVPENTSVSCHHYASYHLPSNFALANSFIPERWLDEYKDTDSKTGTYSGMKDKATDTIKEPEFGNDKKDAFHPFLPGPRTCLGQSLAYSETRLIICILLFNFNIRLCPGSVDWIEKQKVYFLWDKPPLMVSLSERVL